MDYESWVEHHRLLGVAPGASKEELKQAYRRLARVHHPDMVDDETSVQRRASRTFQEIHAAYEALREHSGPPPIPVVKLPPPLRVTPEGLAAGLMAPRRLALAVAALFGVCALAFVVHMERRASPPPEDPAPLFSGDVTSRVAAPKGEFTLVYKQGFAEALEKVHALRRAFYAQQGKGPDFMDTEDRRLHGEDPKVSLFLQIDPQGRLIGALKKTGNPYQPYQIWLFDLNEEGKTGRVEVSPAEVDGQPAVLYRVFGRHDEHLGSITAMATDTLYVKPPSAPGKAAALPAKSRPSDEAIDFVKSFPLDSERGTVEEWLRYAFLSPGFTPQWSARPEAAGFWTVEYTVVADASQRPQLTYRFEADMAHRTLNGTNQAARDLLSPLKR